MGRSPLGCPERFILPAHFVKGGNSVYAVDQPDTTGTLMWRYTIKDGTQVTVRDKGIFKLEGNAGCDALKAQVAA